MAETGLKIQTSPVLSKTGLFESGIAFETATSIRIEFNQIY